MENTNEIWQAEVNGQVYEASFDELAQWIQEGALLPSDRIRRGNLRWIEANKVPALLGYFNAKTTGGNHPVTQTTNTATPDFAKLEGINCVIHNEVEATFYCETCINYLCSNCPKTSGGLSNCCPLCGAICSPLNPEAVPPVVESNAAGEQFIPPEISHANQEFNTKYYSTPRTETAIHAPKRGIGGFILTVFAALLLAAGGAYFYAFQYVKPDEAAEQKMTEVVVLEERYNSDKQGLRLLFANVTTNGNGETQEQAQARLKTKYEAERAEIIANRRHNQTMNSFYLVGGIAFVVMFFGLILLRAMSSK